MTRRRKLLIAGAAALALGAGGVAYAQAGGDDEQATGPEADAAKRAAVRLAGGGTALGVEREDDGGEAWEVEVKRPDGSIVEVSLTAALDRAGVERDDDGGSGEETDGNDAD